MYVGEDCFGLESACLGKNFAFNKAVGLTGLKRAEHKALSDQRKPVCKVLCRKEYVVPIRVEI